MASNRTVYHVVGGASGPKCVVSQKNGNFRQEFNTKAEAENFAKERARGQQPGRVKEHKSDGEDPARTPS
jgi:hypothetical protein